jgi:hypothetical protein
MQSVEDEAEWWELKVIPKPKRIKNKKLLAAVRLQPCGVAGCRNKPEAAHIIPALGDLPENVCPLCWWHHEGEQHIIGWSRFKARHIEVMTYKEIAEGNADPELWSGILERMVC